MRSPHGCGGPVRPDPSVGRAQRTRQASSARRRPNPVDSRRHRPACDDRPCRRPSACGTLADAAPYDAAIAIGAHVDQTDPIAEAQARGAPGAVLPRRPAGLQGPGARVRRRRRRRCGPTPRRRASTSTCTRPTSINVATTNNRIRIPSRKLLQQHVDAAAEIGAKGLIVHGGHVTRRRRPGRRASTTGARRSRPPTSSCRC